MMTQELTQAMTALPTEEFDLEELHKRYENSPQKIEGKKIVKDITNCLSYVSQYFYPLETAEHMFFNGKSFELKQEEAIRKAYLNRFPDEVATHYLKKTRILYKRVCELNKPKIYDKCINQCGSMKHTYKPYKEFTQDIKDKVELILNFYKEVWVSGDEDNYQFIIKWISNMCKGNKNQSLIYLKNSAQGIGKSFGCEFLMYNVIGNSELYLMTSARPLLTGFNQSVFGKLLVVFEEVETATRGEWEKISSSIKRLATCPEMEFEDKNVKSFTGKNICNIIMPTNNEAIKDAEGRRIYNADVSSHRKGDKKYWSEMTKLLNDDVGHAFYCKMLEVDTTGFNSQSFPQTRARDEVEASRLDPLFKTIKFQFIMPKKNIKMTVQDFYDFVKSVKLVKDDMTKITMTKKLREVGINYRTAHGKNKYDITHEKLVEIGNKFHWFNSFDKEEYKNMIKNHTIFKPDELRAEEEDEEKEIEEKDEYIYSPDEMAKEIKSLKKKNDDKDNEIERLKKQILELTQNKKPEHNDNLEPIKIKKSKKEIIDTLFDDVKEELIAEKNKTDETNKSDETVDSLFSCVFSEITKAETPDRKKKLFKNKNNLKN